MRILVLADIHGNWPALRAINEPHDVCICLGDLVDYALEPEKCLDWIRQHAKHTIRGNHDHGVAQNVIVSGTRGYKYLTGVTRHLTRQRLKGDDFRFLARLPITRMLTLDDTRFFLVHATPRDPLDEYGPNEHDFWANQLKHVDADVICVGHTHQPFVLEVGKKLLINPGSVGLQRDGDPRASYAVIEGNSLELKRLEYPLEETVKVIEESTLADVAKKMLAEAFRTGHDLRQAMPGGS